MADSVQLTDLDVIARYSIAVRSATADRDELVETLRADLAWLERGRTRASTTAFRNSSADDDGTEEHDQEPRPARRAAPAKPAATRRTAR
jgi:hypothetical protein